MSYTIDDFSQCLACAGRDKKITLSRSEIGFVIMAWGYGEGMGRDAGHMRFADTSASDWHGGFLCYLKDGRFAYITGWCDYTGWG